MIKSNFLKNVHTAATFLQTFNDFRAKLEPLKNYILTLFQKPISLVLLYKIEPLLFNFQRSIYVFEISKITLKMVTVSLVKSPNKTVPTELYAFN